METAIMTPHGYLDLKLAWELFQKAPETLSASEQGRLSAVAARQQAIELHILASDEAAGVVVPAETLATRLAEVRARYTEEEEFLADLDRLGLDQTSLAAAIERDLRVESVLERIAADTPPVSRVEAEVYYRLHPEAFDRPEARRLRHILMTFNSPLEKIAVRQQLDGLRGTLDSVDAFADAALRHSQCPTALDGGTLGVVKRAQLFETLEPAAFSLLEGEVSTVLESPIGLHLVYCEQVFPSGLLPFDEVCERIVEHLGDKRRRNAQRDWIRRIVGVARSGA
jgi:peptidyl-prolyl cis-trans isomerase C